MQVVSGLSDSWRQGGPQVSGEGLRAVEALGEVARVGRDSLDGGSQLGVPALECGHGGEEGSLTLAGRWV